MALLNLAFLGVPEVRHAEKLISFPTRKSLALLTFVAVEGALQPREKLVGLFWPNSDELRGRGSLRRALVQLRQVLAHSLDDETFHFIAERDSVGLRFDQSVKLDVQVLQTAFNVARSLDFDAGPTKIANWVLLLQQAVEAYRGDFLEGFSLDDAVGFDEWATLQRESWHRRLALVFDRLAQLQLLGGDHIGAIETATRWVVHNPLNEIAQRYLMQLHLDNGDRAAAWQVYQACRNLLQQELNVLPSALTEAIAERIRTAIAVQARPMEDIKPAPLPQIVIADPITPIPHVLVIDDSPDILDILTRQLSGFGYRVTTLSQPREALARLDAAEQPFDLLITDAMMPGFSGYDLVRAIRVKTSSIILPVLMLTSLTSSEDALQAFRDGVDEFLTKPWELEVLRSTIERILLKEPAANLKEVTTPAFRAEISVRQNVKGISSGLASLDKVMGGSWPSGSNILVIGKWGSGKSTFARHFLSEGLQQNEVGMLVSLDDYPEQVLHQLNLISGGNLLLYRQQAKFRLLDGASLLNPTTLERLPERENLVALARAIMEVGDELGQSITKLAGGRRVVDSISSLFLHFDVSLVQRFLKQLAHTAKSYGGVSTLFIIEQETVDENTLNQIKYFMDGILELRYQSDAPIRYEMRVVNLKWQKHSHDWFESNYYLKSPV